jgi:hypothetical protein
LAALDLLAALLEKGGQPGPWTDNEPAVGLELWRTALRTLYTDHANVGRTVQTLVEDLVASGVVIERSGIVAIGDFRLIFDPTRP